MSNSAIQPQATRRRWHLLLITIAFLIAVGWNLTIQSISNPDEPRYAAAVREILRGGDLFVPLFNGEARLQKPILYYWLSAGLAWVVMHAGLTVETALRLEPMWMGLLTAWGAYFLASRLVDRFAALVSTLVLITTNLFHNLSRELLTDMTLTACLTWFAVFLLAGISRQKAGRFSLHLFFLAYFSAGFACLTKGPILLLVFVLLPLFVWKFLQRKAPPRPRIGLWWGIPFSIAAGLWWYFLVIKLGQHTSYFFSADNLQRFTASKGHEHYIPFLYYFINLFESFAPWSLLIPFGIWWTIRTLRTHGLPTAPEHRLILCLGLVPIVILGFAPSKRHIYLLPMYPLLSIWIAWLYREACNATPRPGILKLVQLAFAIVALAALGICAAPLWMPHVGGTTNEVIFGSIFGAGMLLLALMAIGHVRNGFAARAGFCGVGIALLASVAFEGTARPIRERKLALRTFYSDIQKYANGRNILFHGLNANEAVWHLDQNDEHIDEITMREIPDNFLGKPDRLMLIPVASLVDTPLQDAVVWQSPILRRSNEDFVLVCSKPGVVLTEHQLDTFRNVKISKRKHGPLHGL